jgi:hypothetical protein
MKRDRVAEALDRLAPRLPRFERAAVLDHAALSRGLQTASPEEAAWLSLVSFARHTLTDYDELLADGYDQESARHAVSAELGTILAGWGVRRRL